MRILLDPAGPIGGEAARRAAELELQRGEYHNNGPNVFERVLDWLADRFSSVGSGGASGSATLVFIVLIAAVVVFAVWRAGRPRRLARAQADDSDPLATDQTIDHRRRAGEYEAQGRYADALREWLRATIGTIEERGVLDPRPGRTGAGLAREAGAVLPSIAGPLNLAVDTFDEVWFGRRIATAVDVAQAHDVADAVRTARVDTAAQLSGYAVPR